MLRLSIIGRLGGDAVVRDVGDQKVISFTVAQSERYKDRSGVLQERTTWVNCSYFREASRTAIAAYLLKGTQVYVEGTPSTRVYQNREGQYVASIDLRVQNVELLGNKPENSGAPQSQYAPQPQSYAPPQTQYAPPEQNYNPPPPPQNFVHEDSDTEDDLPF